jgi:hypothetical protein
MNIRKRIALFTALFALAGSLVAVLPASASGLLLPAKFSFSSIERLAKYVPQKSCDPDAKPGTAAFLALLQRKFPGTGSSGISRSCSSGGLSEHKEGRALDWQVNYYDEEQRAQAEKAIRWLLKTDRNGKKFAKARRLGVMYMIWDGKIWAANNPGWRAYRGASIHRDHIHISLSWDGALGKTSFWTGKVAR